MVKSYLRMPGPGLRRTIYRWRGTGGAGQIRCGPPMAKTPGGRQVSFRQSQIGDSAAMGIVKVASASRTAPTCWICSGVSSDTGSPRRTPSLGPNVQRRGHSPERWWTSVLGGAASTNRHRRIKHLQRPGRARFLGQGIAVLLGVAAVRANGLPPRRYVKCWTDQAQYSVSAQILPECVRNMVPLPRPPSTVVP